MMKIHIQKSLYVLGITLLLMYPDFLYGTTLVYNMKIRRAFNTSALTAGSDTPITPRTYFLATGLPLFYVRDRKILIPQLRQNSKEKLVALGAIFNLRMVTPGYWWAELSTGLENQSVTSTGTNPFKIGKTGFDDFIISAGKNFFVKNDSQLAFYGIAGFPTKKKVDLSEAQTTLVGSRFYGLGAGMEVSHAFTKKAVSSLVGVLQTRFVHFFDRSWYPIFPVGTRIRPGNITDLFFILQYDYKMNVFEIGYNPTFFTDQGVLFPRGIERTGNYVRNSFYSNYMRLFRETYFCKAPGALGIGLNVSHSSRFDTRIISGWINMTLLF